MPPEVQLRVYSDLRSLEARTQAIEDLIGRLKRSCLAGSASAMTELVPLAVELGWQLEQAQQLAADIASSIGVRHGQESAAKKKAAAAKEAAGIRGSTYVVAVPDLVGLLSSLQKTGTLTLRSDEAMFVFEFQDGKIVHAVTNKADPSLRLGAILVARNLLTEAQLDEGLRASIAGNELIGAHLVRTETVSAPDLRAALNVQVQRIFDEAFTLRFARFTFLEGNLSDLEHRTTLNTTELLLEAARRKDCAALENGGARGSGETRSRLDSILGP